MKNRVLSMIPRRSLNTVLGTALVVTLGVGISACSSEKEADSGKVMAVDRVQEATAIAKANSPKAEDMGFAATAPAANVSTDAEADTTATTEEAATADMADMPEASASADTDMAAADMPAEDSAAEPAADTASTEPK